MAEPQYDDNLLAQYLLGALPAAQTEAFDELSFSDDEFNGQLQAVEDELVDAYVQGELAGERLARFEAFYLASPRRRQQVQFARAFQSFAERRIATRPAVEAPVAETAPSVIAPVAPRAESWWRRFTLPQPVWQWGLAAAAVLLLTGGGWLIWEVARLRNQVEAERAALRQREDALQTELAQQRDAGASEAERLREELRRTREQLVQLEGRQMIAQQRPAPPADTSSSVSLKFTALRQVVVREAVLPPGTAWVVLQLELEGAEFPAYRAAVRTQPDNRQVWASGRLRPKGKVLTVSLRADLLATGGYQLVLTGVAADGRAEEVRSHSFKVVKQ